MADAIKPPVHVNAEIHAAAKAHCKAHGVSLTAWVSELVMRAAERQAELERVNRLGREWWQGEVPR